MNIQKKTVRFCLFLLSYLLSLFVCKLKCALKKYFKLAQYCRQYTLTDIDWCCCYCYYGNGVIVHSVLLTCDAALFAECFLMSLRNVGKHSTQ